MGESRGIKGKGHYFWFLLGLLAIVISHSALNEANAYEEEAVRGGGTISGVVTYSGVVPQPERFRVTMGSNPEFCGSLADEKGMIEFASVRVSKGRLADVVIFLQEVDGGSPELTYLLGSRLTNVNLNRKSRE